MTCLVNVVALSLSLCIYNYIGVGMVQSLWFCLFFVERRCDVVCVFFIVCGGGREEEEKIGVDYFLLLLQYIGDFVCCRLTNTSIAGSR